MGKRGRRGGVRRKHRLEARALAGSGKWIIPPSVAQRALGQLNSESRSEIRNRRQKKSQRVASGIFLPGDLRSCRK